MKSFTVKPEIDLKPISVIDKNLITDLKVILSDDTIIKYLPFQTEPDDKVIQKFLEKIVVKGNLVWGITSYNQLQGIIDLIRIDDDTFSLAYFLSPSLQGEGIVSTSIKWVTEYLFSESKVTNIIAPVVSRNITSIRVLEKNGFTFYKKMLECVNFDGVDDDVFHYIKHRGDN